VEDSGAFGRFVLPDFADADAKVAQGYRNLGHGTSACFSLSCLPLKQLVRPGTTLVNTNLLCQLVERTPSFPLL